MKIFGLILLAPITYLLFIEFLFIMKREKIKRYDNKAAIPKIVRVNKGTPIFFINTGLFLERGRIAKYPISKSKRIVVIRREIFIVLI